MSTPEPHRFWQDGPLAIRSDCGAEVLTLAPVDLQALPDPRRSIRDALQHAEDYPPIHQAIVPGDRITVVVDPNLPSLFDCVAGVLDAIASDANGEIEVVLGEDASEATLQRLTEVVGNQATVHRHDPDDQATLGYLAASESADPIYLNRMILEADFVIPLTIARPDGALDPRCEAGGVFPQFADRRSQQRVRDAQFFGRPSEAAPHTARQQADEAAWLLGIQMVVEVLPTVDALAAEIVAGTPGGVRRKLTASIESSWQRSAPNPPSLVIACIDGDDQQQNWNNVARALHVAKGLVEVGGAIAICCDLTETPGPALRRLASDASYEDLQKATRKDLTREGMIANILLRAREESRIVVASGLPREALEEMGLGAIQTREQLQNLVDQYSHTVVVRAAQFCVATVGEPDEI
ncbi:hypothetical protein Poly24_23070 [Rosistilla carotiformis]|uniref:LarA-like N-terminal domain-containing protein n=1 Tax=Rosistilla carotiformis TaxID=2528017 RepID=A0A518JST6_9BACT|nr:lactate racemase domain-containing protein [Rosistilla carotiformis]QDV68597.1 hypothetical protein Poly24_23070 [Rosistilla carotiformis]